MCLTCAYRAPTVRLPCAYRAPIVKNPQAMTTIVFWHRPRAVVLRQVAGIIFWRLVLIILLRLFPRLVLLLL